MVRNIQSVGLLCSVDSPDTEMLAFAMIIMSYEIPKYAVQHGLELENLVFLSRMMLVALSLFVLSSQ